MEEIHVPAQDNSPSIEHTLRPISYTSWFMGVGVARPRKCSMFQTIYLRFGHMVICTTYLIQHIRYASHMSFVFNMDVFKFMYVIDRATDFVSTYYYIYHGIRQYNKWPELMDKMKEFDRKIKRETHTNDQPVKKLGVIASLMTFACCPVLIVVHAQYLSYLNLKIRYFDLLIYYTTARSLINSFVFDIVVYVLYNRYQTINKLLDQLNELSDAPLIAFKIRRIRELHNDICDLVSTINDIHGFHLLLCSANCFSIIVIKLFLTYKYVKSGYDDSLLLFNTIWIIYIIQFGLICWICTLVRQEFDKTKIIMCAIALKFKSMNFDKLNDTMNQPSLEVQPALEDAESEQNSNWNNSHDWNYAVMDNLLHKILDRDHVRKEINDFLIQLEHCQVSFTACDFFKMNINLFCGFIGIIVTYCIIFIQFTT
ncbi:uncharacterized protein LOC105835922 isoform X1 [Monomorium pharaonis]|uniref:uncharacterized protein LOC105835921 isoform X1 n=1 Tax=Monomorium pharaonis TaxID=307658 RepID=UPI001746E5DF|nr:uncharacterized protein LOC105835921 isoform X1 [Monomorium pharaonis]XP_036150721.1 uncharacterized protein LOC105835922 isoform X1 [Monomorium pharaonis]